MGISSALPHQPARPTQKQSSNLTRARLPTLTTSPRLLSRGLGGHQTGCGSQSQSGEARLTDRLMSCPWLSRLRIEGWFMRKSTAAESGRSLIEATLSGVAGISGSWDVKALRADRTTPWAIALGWMARWVLGFWEP